MRTGGAPPAFTPATPPYLAASRADAPLASYGADASDLVCRYEPDALTSDDSLLTSRLDDTVRASAAVRHDSTSRAAATARPPPAPAAPAAAGARPAPPASGSAVAQTRAAGDRAADDSAAAATAPAAAAAAPEDGAATARGPPEAGGSRRSDRQAKKDQEHDRQQKLLRLAQPRANPATGGSGLARESFAVDVRVRPFPSSRAVGVPAEQRPATGRDGKPLPAPSLTPAAAAQSFANAIGAAEAMYNRLIAAARELASGAVRDNLRSGDRMRSALDRDLSELDEILAEKRISSDRGREFAHERVRMLERKMRRRIHGAAGSALGRLARMKQTYETLMGPPRTTRAEVTSNLATALSEIVTKANDAHAALQDFGQAPDAYLTIADFPADEGEDAVSRAMLEAALQYIVPYITADDQATADRLTAIESILNPLNQCLPCQMDGAFQLLDMRMDHLSVAGPRAVAASRDGALKAVDDLVERLTLSIDDTHGTIDRQLVGQHDRTRRDLIAQMELDGSAEREDFESMATRQSDMLAALADGQGRGVVEVQHRMARLAERGGGDYASALLAAANRLRSNVAGMQRRYPAEPLAMAAAKGAARGQRHASTDRLRARTLAAMAEGMTELVRSTFAEINEATDKGFADMHDTPERVRSSCESFLGPAEEARNAEVASLVAAVNGLRDRVAAAISGTSAGGGGSTEPGGMSSEAPEAQVCSAEPSASSSSSSAGATPEGGGGNGGGGQTMPPPASCSACPSANGEGAAAAEPGAPAGGTGSGPGSTPAGAGSGADGAASTTTTPAPTATSGGGDNYISSIDFRAYCDRVAGDPKQAEGTKAFIHRVSRDVPRRLAERAGAANSALNYSWRQPDTGALMTALRGLTTTSGPALQQIFGKLHGSLRDRINEKYDDMLYYTFASTDTIRWNRRAALDAIEGDVTGAAMNELRASFNYSNEDERIRTILGSLTPAQMAALPASELDELATQLDGEDLVRFNALRRGHGGGTERAITLRNALDAANRLEGDARGRAVQDAIRQAHSGSPELAIEGDATREVADIFDLEHPSLRESRRAGRWHETLSAFGELQSVRTTLARLPSAPGAAPAAGASRTPPTAHGATPPASGTTPASEGDAAAAPTPDAPEPAPNPDRLLEDALIRYATRDIYHPPPRPRGGARGDFDSRPYRPAHWDHMAPDMVNWVEQSVRHGPDSVQARGAQLLVEFNRPYATGSAERLESTLHIGSADAREGGGYAPRPTDAAERERDRVFDEFARFRMSLGGDSFIGPIDPRTVRAEVRDRFSTALVLDPAARGLALGIIDSEHGNPQAAIEYALARENTAMALRYLRRMDRAQIDQLVRDWNRDHPRGPGLYQRLGLFQHHWSVTDWNGAAFTGDEANELEIAFMGVPQNDRERAEVALRTMNQQIEQSTGLGQTVAGEEYQRLVANRDTLLRLIGRDNSHLDELGRLRVTDPITGEALGLGNFDSSGNFLPAHGRSATGFETAVALAKYTATDFTQAVDAAASFFTTLLVVIAAVVTTALTGGAAASIWIPMLVTAAAGLAGVAMTAALKGGRYSRDEVTRDLIMVAVQTLTAGIGAAGSIAARGGMPALRAVASRGISQGFRISERALERFVVSKGGTLAASASFGAELGIAAASGAISGGVTAAIDPANRHSEDYGSRILGGIFRGAAGAAVGAGVARGAAAGLGSAGNRLAANAASRSARSALASGLSREQAIERALLAARRANWVASGITRSISSGASGSASQMTELGLEGRASLDEILAAGRTAFFQNALQGAMEHGADPAARNPYRRGGAHVTEADLRGMPSWQRQEHQHMRAMAAEMVANQYDGPAPAARAAGPADAADPARPRGPGVEDPASSAALPLRLRPVDDTAVTVRPAAPDEAEAGGRPRPIDDDEAEILRSNRNPDLEDTQPIPRSEIDAIQAPPPPPPPRPWLPAMSLDELGRQVTSHGTRVEDTADLTVAGLRAMPVGLPVDSIIRATNRFDEAAAMSNFRALRDYNPSIEVLLARNVRTGEYAVVVGEPDNVRKPPPPTDWDTERHVHPRTSGTSEQSLIRNALPSGDPGDVGTLIRETLRLAERNGGVGVRVSKIDVVQPDFTIAETTFSVIVNGTDVSIGIHFRDPAGRMQELGPYTNLADYDADVIRLTGMDLQANRKLSDPEGSNAPARLPPRVEPVTDEARAAAHFVARNMTAADAADAAARARAPTGAPEPPAATSAARAEAHAAVRRLGLVGEPDSLARLTALINDPDLDPAVRSAIAEATLQATREEMRRTGALAPGDDVVMLMRGVTGTRLGDYEGGGIDLSKLAPTTNEDAGRGLYGSQDLQSAEGYTGAKGTGGQVLPLIVRRSELGNVIDVRSGTPLGDRWLRFIRANPGSATIAESPRHPHLSGVLFPGYNKPMALEGAGRGARFDAFLRSLEADPSLPDSVRAAARDPHITFMDLGGVASTGNDRSMLTDQWAMRSQHIADMFNRAHGFPVPGREGPEGTTRPTRIHPDGGDEESRSLSPVAPAREPDSNARLAAGLLDNLAGGRRDPSGHLAGLLQLAPETVTAFFTRLLDSARRGDSTALSDTDMARLEVDLARRSVPPALAEKARAAFRTIASPDHPIHARVIEAAPHSRFYRGVVGSLRAAFERRAAIETARRFGRTRGTNEHRLLVKRLVQSDPDAVANFIRSGDSLDERVAAFARERVAQGERFQDAQRDGYALARAIETTEFGKVRDRVNALLARIDRAPRALADLVRQQPEALLSLAHSSPQLLSEFYVDLIFKRMARTKQDDGTFLPGDFTTPAATRLADYVGTRMISNVLPVASEVSVVWSLRAMGLTMLKADSAQAGGANRPGLDIVAFGRLNGRDPTTGGPVRLMIADDKAYRKTDFMGINELQSVSAMQGPRFARNLRATAAELRAQIRQIELIPGLASKMGYPEYLAGARAAIRQMTRAAGEIERMPPVPKSRNRRRAHIRSEAYARALAVILNRHHIEQVVTSRHGNINELAKWLRWQGFLLEDEYLRRLAAMIAFSRAR